MKQNINDLIRSPATAAVSVFSAVSLGFSIGWVDAVAAVLWGQLATIFTVFSIGAFTVLPNVDLGALTPLQEVVTVLALLSGVLYAAKLGSRVVNDVEDKV